jgi:hypothetical protein
MMNSTTLQITTQAVGGETLIGDVSIGVFRRSYPSNIGRCFSSPCMLYTTRECGGPAASSPPSSAGHRWPRPLLRWPGLAYTDNGARFTDMYTYSQQRYRYLTAVSPTSTWTWSGRCQPRSATPTCSPSLTEPRDGWRPSRLPPPPPQTAPRPSSPAGYHNLESQPPSHQTEGPNSRPLFGRACAAYSTSSTCPQQHTTLSQTDWQAVPQAAEGCLEVPGRRRQLAQPPPLGAAGYQGRQQRGQ